MQHDNPQHRVWLATREQYETMIDFYESAHYLTIGMIPYTLSDPDSEGYIESDL